MVKLVLHELLKKSLVVLTWLLPSCAKHCWSRVNVKKTKPKNKNLQRAKHKVFCTSLSCRVMQHVHISVSLNLEISIRSDGASSQMQPESALQKSFQTKGDEKQERRNLQQSHPLWSVN